MSKNQMSWELPILPLRVDHWKDIAQHPAYLACTKMLSTIDPNKLTELFGPPFVKGKTYKIWRIGSIGISGFVEPYCIVFNRLSSNVCEKQILSEIVTIHSILLEIFPNG